MECSSDEEVDPSKVTSGKFYEFHDPDAGKDPERTRMRHLDSMYENFVDMQGDVLGRQLTKSEKESVRARTKIRLEMLCVLDQIREAKKNAAIEATKKKRKYRSEPRKYQSTKTSIVKSRRKEKGNGTSRRRSRKRKSVLLVDEEAEEVPHSVAVEEENVNRPERPGDILDSVKAEDVPEAPDDEK